MDIKPGKCFCLFLGIISLLGLSAAYKSVEDPLTKDCFHMLHHIQHEHVEVPQPPDISGEWTSSRCENRPGPEYLLRKYRFTSETFRIYQYYYSDPDCIHPVYAIKATGTYQFVRNSWSVPGGSEADYQIRDIYLIPYTREFLSEVKSRTPAVCPLVKFSQWKLYQKQKIYNFPEMYDNTNDGDFLSKDYDCSRIVWFSLHELQLMRLERRVHQGAPGESGENLPQQTVEDTLFVGSLHTEFRSRQYHRPTSYQPGLRRSESTKCTVCSRIANSNLAYPPTLSKEHKTLTDISGEWSSMRCETRQHGMFITRHISFASNQVWKGEFVFYHDAHCQERSFTVSVSGNFTTIRDSEVIKAATNYDFAINRAKITPHDDKTTENLNGYKGKKCGHPKSWVAGVTQDVTSTHGCVPLGIRLPSIGHDIVRIEYRHRNTELHMGEVPTDMDTSAGATRPTSFQPPLMKCHTPRPEYLVSRRGHGRRHIDGDFVDGSAGSNVISWSVLLTVLLFSLCYVVH